MNSTQYDLTEANNRFTFDVYKKLGGEEKGNLFFSPFSILAAFAMMIEGAQGKTAEEIQNVFHFPKDTALLRSTFSTLYAELNKKKAKYKLHMANALWVQQGLKLLKTYQDRVRKFYGGEAKEVHFGDGAKAAKIINTWIEGKTNHKILNFFKPEDFTNLTQLVLTNAIYFKGLWLTPFDKKETKEEEFRMSPNKAMKVSMMRLEEKELKFLYAETEAVQILEVPYQGEDLSMLILLPKKENLSAIEKELTLDTFNRWRGLLRFESVFIYLPTFTFKKRYELNESLIKMGMPTAFTPRADFSRIFGKPEIFISSV
ncbi:MAG: serpin family protein, partial [Deltaproteobacteria bacterium]|nr:serpin family protein [Deltaproteobacteria bacterium]